jgi:putative phage-type endonuclease
LITDKQRENRRRYIGGSDAASILGVDPWKTKVDLWLEKTGRLVDEPLTSEPAELGSDIEDSLLRWFQREYRLAERGLMLLRNQHFVADPFGPHLDAAIVPAGKRGRADITEIVEAKVTSLVDEWGDELTDQVPDRVLVQAHVQMYATGEQCRTAWVPVMMPGYRSFQRRRYRIDRNDELMSAIVSAGLEFWEHVQSNTQPPDSYPTLDVLERRRREPQSIVEFDRAALELITKWESAKSREVADGKEVKALRAQILALLGDAEGGALPDGRLLTFLSQRSAPSVDHDGFKMAHPDIYERFVKQGSHRTLRIAEPKVKGAWK